MSSYESDPTVVQVEVTVSTGPHDKVTIVCNPNPVNVTVANTMLAFNLRTPGYHFKGLGAVVLAEPNDDFPYPSWTLDRTTAGLFDLCNQADEFDYTVSVKRDHDGAEFSVDPIINNGDASGNHG
jgi:hypothetical protein